LIIERQDQTQQRDRRKIDEGNTGADTAERQTKG
jgi:hypothetical protein